jgi:hypothetical protein
MMQVRKSINIKYDSKNTSLINEYYATSSHSEIIRHVFNGILGGNTRAHIAYGPYGAGKSFISTILTGFTSQKYHNNDIRDFIVKFKKVDTESATLFKSIQKHETQYIPVLMNGYEGKFDKALVRNLKAQLLEHGYEIDDRKVAVTEIVENWKQNFDYANEKFNQFLTSNSLTIDSFYNQLNDDEIFRNFEALYERITSGAKLNINQDSDLITAFEKTSSLLAKDNKGLILVYDEFGRMLQNILPEEINQFMQQLQDLAELVNNSCKNVTLLFVAHKPISHYFSYLEKDKRNEFAKIEKRFSVTSIQSDHATFINIASQFIQELQLGEISLQLFKSYSKNATKFNLFSHHFNATEVDELIIKGSYPIHPVTMFLLPMISKVFGQNERTLFSFLSDTSTDGFLGYSGKKKNIVYYPDKLADYFFLSFEENFEFREISILKNNLGLIQQQISNHLVFETERVFKLIALWGLTNANNYVPINDDFIAFSLGLKKERAESILDELANIKLIRYNRDKRYWHVIESGSIDLENEIKLKKQYLIANPQLVNQTLNRNNPYKYIYTHDHNNTNEITRFALMNIVLDGYQPTVIMDSKYDFLVQVIVNPKDATKHNHDIYCEMQYDEEKLISLINRLTVVDILMHDRSFLHLYKNAIVDLEYEKSRLMSELNDFYKSVFKQSYLINGKEKKVTKVQQLEKYLNDLANEVYSHSIVVHNDQINMFVLTTQQLNASLEVIKKMLDKESFEMDDSFEGSKPDFLIYYSLKQASEQENFISLKNRIIDYLNQHPAGKFTDLTKIATNPPYGVRPTLAPLIVLSVIIDRLNNMMLSRDGNYIATIDAKQIYDAAQGKNDFEYTYSNFDFEHRDWMKFILDNFPAPSEGVLKKSQSIQVLSSLFNWFNHLPVIIQQGQQVGMQEKYFLRNIEQSKTNPFEALKKLIEYSQDDVKELKINISNAYNIHLENLEDNLLKEFGIEDWQSWAQSCDLIKQKSNTLVKIALKNKRIIREYSKEIDTIEIERWTIGSYEKLISIIKSDFLDASDKLKTFLIEINGVKREVNDIEIGSKAKNLKRNLESLIDANNRYITQSEVEKVIIELIEKYVK